MDRQLGVMHRVRAGGQFGGEQRALLLPEGQETGTGGQLAG
jgi:hypothetical protein